MCYFPIKIKNKRLVPTKKNGYEPPVCTDERFRYIEVECGYCFECRKKKRNTIDFIGVDTEQQRKEYTVEDIEEIVKGRTPEIIIIDNLNKLKGKGKTELDLS